jgi:hypothetical protein
MMSAPEEFAAAFDSVRVEPKAPPAADAPGFYLLDDCNGRFVIDRDIGVITLAHEHLLTLEAGAVHIARVRVIEMSGANYEMNMRLRVSGRVPQIVGHEGNDMLAGLAAAPLVDLMSPQEKSVHEVTAPEPPPLPWVRFAASRFAPGKRALYGETAPFGSLFEIPSVFPDVYLEDSELALDAAPPRASANDAAWVI